MIQEILNLPYFNCSQTTRYAFDGEGNSVSIESFYELYERYKQQDITRIEKIKTNRD